MQYPLPHTPHAPSSAPAELYRRPSLNVALPGTLVFAGVLSYFALAPAARVAHAPPPDDDDDDDDDDD